MVRAAYQAARYAGFAGEADVERSRRKVHMAYSYLLSAVKELVMCAYKFAPILVLSSR